MPNARKFSNALPVSAREIYRILKNNAQQMITYAVREGRLPHLKIHFMKCTDCEKRAVCYDHRDYFDPLIVEPVCHSCNLLRGTAKKTFDKIALTPVKRILLNL